MSDLLVIVPEGWADVTDKWNESGADIAHITMLINDRNWVDVQSELQGADINAPEGKVLTGASFLTLDDGIHLWVRFE